MSNSWAKRGMLLAALAMAAFAANADYRQHPQVGAFVDTMVAEHGFEREELLDVLASAEYKQSIIDAMKRPAEKVLEWKDYRKIFIREKRIRQGVEFWQTYREALERAEREYGVPASIIVGIIGVETYYGGNKGSYRVLDALATLGFDYPPRAEFFSRQLGEYLLMTREQKFDPLALKGSYAGAMGFGQFIPSSYRSFAVDFDGDGVADIIDNPVDAIGSVANYFSRHNWRPGDPVVTPASASNASAVHGFPESLKPEVTVGELAEAGILPFRALPAYAEATLINFQGERGEELWIGLHNFYVITRYNHSAMYAMAVYQLSQLIAQRMPS